MICKIILSWLFASVYQIEAIKKFLFILWVIFGASTLLTLFFMPSFQARSLFLSFIVYAVNLQWVNFFRRLPSSR